MEKRYCPTCNKLVSKNNKSGFCNSHRPRSGKDNPFYGKKHSKELIDQIRKKNSIAMKKKWQNPEYREEVIRKTSKPRHAEFKKEQSERITQWYKDNPKQKTIRSEYMKKSWKENRIVPSTNSINESKIEINLLKEIQKIYPDACKKTLRDKQGWIIPDIILEKQKIIIEFYGDFWHFNPKYYSHDDYNIKIKMNAQEMWDKDKKRLNRIHKLGYKTYIVWQDEYKKNKQLVIDNIKKFIN